MRTSSAHQVSLSILLFQIVEEFVVVVFQCLVVADAGQQVFHVGDKAAGVEARTVNGDVLPLFDQADDIADHRAGVEKIGLRGHGVLGVDEMQRNGGGFFFGQAHTEALVDARHSLGGQPCTLLRAGKPGCRRRAA